jgi:hypothetical protein
MNTRLRIPHGLQVYRLLEVHAAAKLRDTHGKTF